MMLFRNLAAKVRSFSGTAKFILRKNHRCIILCQVSIISLAQELSSYPRTSVPPHLRTPEYSTKGSQKSSRSDSPSLKPLR